MTSTGRQGPVERPALADRLPAVTNDIVTTIDPIQVWLFGSVARCDDNPDSDIDLLIAVEHHRRAGALGGLGCTIRRTNDVPARFGSVPIRRLITANWSR